jgi:hypothetical protein
MLFLGRICENHLNFFAENFQFMADAEIVQNITSDDRFCYKIQSNKIHEHYLRMGIICRLA